MSLGYCIISVLKHSPFITSKEISYNYDQLIMPQCSFETSSCSYNVGDQTHAFTDCSILMTRKVTRLLRRLFFAVINWRIVPKSLIRYVTERKKYLFLTIQYTKISWCSPCRNQCGDHPNAHVCKWDSIPRASDTRCTAHSFSWLRRTSYSLKQFLIPGLKWSWRYIKNRWWDSSLGLTQ